MKLLQSIGRFLTATVTILALIIAFAAPGQTLVFLAGGYDGKADILGVFMFIWWPVTIFIFMMTLAIDNCLRRPLKRVRNWNFRPGIMTSLCGFFYFLPIIMNGLSIALTKMGMESASHHVFT